MEPPIQTSSINDFHLLGFNSKKIINGSVKYFLCKDVQGSSIYTEQEELKATYICSNKAKSMMQYGIH